MKRQYEAPVVAAVILIGCILPGCDNGSRDVIDATDSGPVTLDIMEDGVADTLTEMPGDTGLGDEINGETWVSPLPFELERQDFGEPLTDAEITEFTRAITGFWKDTEYFRWVKWHSHGVHPSNPEGQDDYALWWQDTRSIKEGNTITFQHYGGADNITLRTCKVLNNAIALYLMSGDEDAKWLVEQYCKGLAALSKGMEWGGENPVIKYIQARAIFTTNQEYDIEPGRHVKVDYDPVKQKVVHSWNASTIPNVDNPYWPGMWVRNQRSKDDVPHMFRTVPLLMRLKNEAPDADVKAAAGLALEYLRGFAKDIVDSGYLIRTKENGQTFVPNDDGAIKDLASLVMYEEFIPNAECNGKLNAALIAYGEPLDNQCLDGSGGAYEEIATTGHYFNYAIIRYFHAAAVANSLAAGDTEDAKALLQGWISRADRMMHDPDMPNRDSNVWDSDVAATLIVAASAGLPLTSEEARLIQKQYLLSADHYRDWPYWDPWDESVPDGEFPYKPDRGTAVRPTEIAYLLEYCASSWRNEMLTRLVDCDVVADPARWGK
ncbi:MAG: hypothetical protein GXP54_12935 [Deltaproteobacteria bacterium]|nr:hypothetical protein [Deltaproteobacteria bacterium]